MTVSSPAFPSSGMHILSSGISKRDYFAAAALQGMLANPETVHGDFTSYADHAYKFADAMLDARDAE